jgi:hypothetical protein
MIVHDSGSGWKNHRSNDLGLSQSKYSVKTLVLSVSENL